MTTQNKDILYYEKTGQGPIIVLLHGYMTAGRYWDSVRTQLGKNYTVITIDLLGFGNSPKPKHSNYDYEEHLAWVASHTTTCRRRQAGYHGWALYGHPPGTPVRHSISR